ncbi:MAG TPA: hypothetical protein VFX49_09030 [Chloroflexota bacterium]|nr:hypothetical protein [Chloroflexota bacterium]
MQTLQPPNFQRLAAYLDPRPARTVTLTFDEIERAVGGALPLDAYERRQWWLSAEGGPKRRLHAAGWHVLSVDVLGHVATFGRN